MKKLVILVVVAFGIGLFSSCKKDHDCECTYPDNSELNQVHTIEDSSKGDAEDACDKLDDAAKQLDGSCELK